MAKLEDQIRQVLSGKLAPEQVMKLSARDAIRVGRFGLGLLEQQDLEGAEACGQVCARFCPKSPLGWFVLGNAAARQDKAHLAVYGYEQAVRLAPNLIQLWIDLAEAYLQLPDYDRAGKALRGILAIDPQAKTPQAKRAQLLIGQTFMALTGDDDA